LEFRNKRQSFNIYANKRFTASKKPLTQEIIKGTLLSIADQMVGTIAEVIQENAEHDKHGIFLLLDVTILPITKSRVCLKPCEVGWL
jgi:hypothetical protein